MRCQSGQLGRSHKPLGEILSLVQIQSAQLILSAMTLNKLFIRFLKENNIYGGDASKRILNYFTKYGAGITIPFNGFTWRYTVQGHNYWYEKSIGWIIFLIDNPYLVEGLKPEEKEKISEKTLISTLTRLVYYYCLEGEDEKTKMEMPMYRKAKEILNINNKARLKLMYSSDEKLS